MFSQTNVALISYMLRVAKDVVNRNLRFRRALGDVSMVSSNAILFGNVQVLIRDISTGSERLSPDHFMTTLTGRSILTRIVDKDGSFFEWVRDNDPASQTPPAGVYYFNVNSVDEGSRDVEFTIETYRWYEGAISVARGTKLEFRDGIDATEVILQDTLGAPPVWQAGADYAYLLSFPTDLIITYRGSTLAPMTDYWVSRQQSQVLIEHTLFGGQTAKLPIGFSDIQLFDQDGYQLKPGSDFVLVSDTEIRLSAWTPANQTIYVVGSTKVDPSVRTNLIEPENVLNVTLPPGETLVPGQCFVSTQDADHVQVTPNPDGTITLPDPLPPGGWCRYEVRSSAGQTVRTAKKNAVTTDLIPGLIIAIGDTVIPSDQCAILVSPLTTETYRVYGGRPNVSFTIDVKANDPTTADEISKAIQQDLLLTRRVLMENDGLSIFEVASSFSAGVRDDSGTAPTYTVSTAVSAAADWRVFEPLVTRVTAFTVNTIPVTSFWGSFDNSTRFAVLGSFGFANS